MLKSRSAKTIAIYLLIGLGSIVILTPAWLPNQPTLPVEDSVVQFLQVALLFGSAAFFFAAGPHAKKMKPIFQSCGYIAILATLGEQEDLVNRFIRPLKWSWLIVFLAGIILIKISRNMRAFRSFVALATRTPASGFLGAALILVYLFSELFGSDHFWKAALSQDPPEKLASTLKEYLELLACYFIFVATAGFCLPLTRRN